MIAVKAFNSKLQATLGNGVMTFEPGRTYEEPEAKCAHNGFHCAENPLCALGYYNSMDSRFFIVEAGGEINQDGQSSRISCTKLTLKKEISRLQLAYLACEYIRNHPDREESATHLENEKGRCSTKGDFCIIRGKDPAGSGVKGSYIFLLKEENRGRSIRQIYPFFVDGEEIKENTYYGLRGDRLCRKNI